MRKSAYLKAVAEARTLPTEIPELKKYFRDGYNPRAMALAYIIKKAREDTDGLFDGETVEVITAAKA